MSKAVMITGTVKYSHITRHTTDEELVRAQQARKSKFKDNPHSYVSLENVQVIPSDPSGQLTPAEQLVASREFFTKASTPGVFYYQPKNASNRLANVFIKSADGNYTPVKNDRELKQGVQVVVQLRQYEAFAKQHFNMDSIFVNSEDDFYTGGNNTFLAQAGFNIVGTPIVTEVPKATATPAPQQPAPQPVQPQPGYFVPQSAPQVNPNYNQPLPGVEQPVTGPYNPPVQPTAPVQQAPYQAPQVPYQNVDPLLSGEGIPTDSGITYQ